MIKRSDFLANEVVDLREEMALVSPTDTPLTTLLMSRGAVVPAKDITVTWREKQLNTQRGTLIAEGAEAGTPINSTRGTLSNLCQIIEKVTQVSGTAEALNPLGIGKSFESEVSDRLIETKRDLEWYMLNGTKTSESESGGTVTPRQMGGLVNQIYVPTSGTDNHVQSLVSGTGESAVYSALTEDIILNGLEAMWDSGAQGEYYAFMDATVKRIVNNIFKNGTNVRINIENGIAQVQGVTVQRIESDFGVINLVLNRHMAPENAATGHTFLAVDLDEVEIAELRGTFYEDLPKSGDYFKGHIINESTIKLLNSRAAMKITNITK